MTICPQYPRVCPVPTAEFSTGNRVGTSGNQRRFPVPELLGTAQGLVGTAYATESKEVNEPVPTVPTVPMSFEWIGRKRRQ